MRLRTPLWPLSASPHHVVGQNITSISTKKVTILDDDRPTITLSVDDTSITEGDTATFTLTRGNNAADELIVRRIGRRPRRVPGGQLRLGGGRGPIQRSPSLPAKRSGRSRSRPRTIGETFPDNAFTFTVAAGAALRHRGFHLLDRCRWRTTTWRRRCRSPSTTRRSTKAPTWSWKSDVSGRTRTRWRSPSPPGRWGTSNTTCSAWTRACPC